VAPFVDLIPDSDIEGQFLYVALRDEPGRCRLFRHDGRVEHPDGVVFARVSRAWMEEFIRSVAEIDPDDITDVGL
jgi:hypothetical protein